MLRVNSTCACTQVGSFVIGRRWGKEEEYDLAREENPRCIVCDKPMIWNNGKYGIWFECECGHKADESGRPKKTRGQRQSNPPEAKPSLSKSSLDTCPRCGKPLREKNGRFGRFVGCTGYPKCKYTSKITDKRQGNLF
jgi:DNA topoisomerase-1